MSDLLRKLSTELGRDAVAEANYRHPELRTCSDAHVNELLAAVERVMEIQHWPRTVEAAERAYRALECTGELGRIASQYGPAAAPEGFTPKSGIVEETFLRTAPIEQVAQYLKDKYEGKP
jgi:hypothetical protein